MSGLRIKAVIEVRISSWGQIGTNGGQMGAICPTKRGDKSSQGYTCDDLSCPESICLDKSVDTNVED